MRSSLVLDFLLFFLDMELFFIFLLGTVVLLLDLWLEEDAGHRRLHWLSLDCQGDGGGLAGE